MPLEQRRIYSAELTERHRYWLVVSPTSQNEQLRQAIVVPLARLPPSAPSAEPDPRLITLGGNSDFRDYIAVCFEITQLFEPEDEPADTGAMVSAAVMTRVLDGLRTALGMA